MKKLNSLFFILFLLIIIGSFASFAQNSYGITIISWTLSILGITCFLAGIREVLGKKPIYILAAEYIVLALIFGFVTLRSLYIHFNFVELLFALLCLLLTAIYIYHIYVQPRQNKVAFLSTILIYGGIVLFTISLAVTPYSSELNQGTGIAGFILVLTGFVLSRRKQSITYQDKEISYLRYLTLQPNQAVLVLSFFMLLSVYAGARMINLLPEIHSSKMPEAYYELVEKTENNLDIPEGGKFEYEIYKEKMDSFMNKRGLED